MSVPALETGVANSSTSFASQPNVLGKDDFLTLLVTQLQHQDPLNPMESTEFTAQLAQFSSLEQLNNVNENLQYLQLYQASLNNSQAVSFIGKNVDAVCNTILVDSGASEMVHLELFEDAKAVYVSIYDSYGELVRSLEAGPLNAGEQSVNWDVADSEGNSVPDGKYTFEIMAVDINDESVDVLPLVSEKVSGVTFNDGVTYLRAGGHEISIGDVLRISEPEN